LRDGAGEREFPYTTVHAHVREVGRRGLDLALLTILDNVQRCLEQTQAVGHGLLRTWLPLVTIGKEMDYAAYVGLPLLGASSFGDASVATPLLAELRSEVAPGPLWARRVEGINRSIARLGGEPAPAPFSLPLQLALLPMTPIPEEVLFLRCLQAFEVLFAGVGRLVRDGTTHSLERAAGMIRASISIFSVLATMPPVEFAKIRSETGTASALHSPTFEVIERACSVDSDEARWEIGREWARWKRAHLALAVRMIGDRPGTGGTAGVAYLRDRVTPPPVGPPQQRLAEAAGKVLGIAPDVQQCPRPVVGEFVLDLRTGDNAPDQAGCAAAARAMLTVPMVATARAVQPRVYVTPTLDALRSAVVETVRERGATYGRAQGAPGTLQVQFSCPNLNKALHLGHLRSNFIGMALANLAEALGYDVMRVDQPSSRGRHIAKALLAYRRWGGGRTPESDGTKPDHFVGKLYARFAQENGALDNELDELVARLDSGDDALDAEVERLTSWSYEGIEQTYRRIATCFDAVCPEGDAVPLALACIEEHLDDGCWRRPDGSVFVDLSRYGLRPVTILRRGGGALLHAQFLGACIRRRQIDGGAPLLFVMGHEYKDTIPELLGVLQELGQSEFAARFEAVYHGMVSVDGRKMSSRGEVLEADLLLDRVRDRLGGREALAVALVKFHFLRFRRRRDIDWREEELWSESLPRLNRVMEGLHAQPPVTALQRMSAKAEGRLRSHLLMLNRFPAVVAEAFERRDPAGLVRQAELVATGAAACLRDGTLDADLHEATRIVMARALDLLGIELPDAAD
jgi:arginyl-tRNA synthetase